MSQTNRCFIAIELPQEIQRRLCKIQSELKATGADAKWVKQNNIHLTLKFLGNLDSAAIAKVTAVLEQTTVHYTPFSVEISEVGAFPTKESPRVIWVGVKEGKEKISAMVEELENSLQNIDIPKEEREFHPHITIGRLKSSFNRVHLVTKLKEITVGESMRFNVQALTLFKSTLTPKGPIYEVLKAASFNAS
ncbi:RNA 2',3'-cyclic phosphodiesterase [Candidatus Omnitrophota bacterium]